MIDEINEKLRDLEILVGNAYSTTFTARSEFYSELIRLARLGLWAEQEGIPALKAFEQCDSDKKWCALGDGAQGKVFHSSTPGYIATEALAARPKRTAEIYGDSPQLVALRELHNIKRGSSSGGTK